MWQIFLEIFTLLHKIHAENILRIPHGNLHLYLMAHK